MHLYWHHFSHLNRNEYLMTMLEMDQQHHFITCYEVPYDVLYFPELRHIWWHTSAPYMQDKLCRHATIKLTCNIPNFICLLATYLCQHAR